MSNDALIDTTAKCFIYVFEFCGQTLNDHAELVVSRYCSFLKKDLVQKHLINLGKRTYSA